MSALTSLLGLIGLAAAIVASIALVRGHLDRAHLRNRKHAGALLAASVIAFILASALTPEQVEQTAPPEPASTPPPTSTSTTTTAPVTSHTTAPPTIESSSATAVPAPALPPGTTPQARLPEPLPFAPQPPPVTTAPAPPPAVQPAPKSAPAEVYYANCAEARAAHAAPIRRGQPGYAPHLDRDNDGIACE